MRETKFVFRIDGRAALGFGHAARCLALMRALGAERAARFETTVADDAFAEQLRGTGFAGHVSLYAGPATTRGIVVFDLYDISHAEVAAWRAAGHRIVAIEDAGVSIDCDLLVSPGPQQSPDAYDPVQVRRALVGPAFALVDPAFYRAVPAATVRQPRLLVAFGGIDRLNAAEFVLVALDAYDGEVDVVLGRGYAQYATVQGFASASRRFHRSLDRSAMVALMHACDAAVVSAGVTSLELAASRVPMLVLATSAHEIAPAEAFERRRMAVYAGFLPEIEPAAFAAKLVDFLGDGARRADLRKTCAQVMPESGLIAVAAAIRELEAA